MNAVCTGCSAYTVVGRNGLCTYCTFGEVKMEEAKPNQQSNGQKAASQVGTGAIVSFITDQFIPAEMQAQAGPALFVVLNFMGKFLRNVLADSKWAKYLP